MRTWTRALVAPGVWLGIVLVAVSLLLAHRTAQAALLEFQLFAAASGISEQFNGFVSFMNIPIASVNAPAQASFAPGDVLEIEFFAPTGQAFLVSPPAGASFTSFRYFVANAGAVIGVATTIDAQAISVSGETLGGTLTPSGTLVYTTSNNDWFARAGVDISGAQTFTSISAQFVIPAGVTRPLTPLIDGTQGISLSFSNDPGPWISLVPSNVVPEPATLVMLGFGLAGLGFARRRKSP